MGYTFCILSRVLLSFFIISHLSIILQLFIVLFYILFEGQNSCGQEVISLDTILRLRELMNSRGWSEYRLAKESKLSMSTISNIFHRGSIPSIPTLETLCNTFGISLGQFFSKGVSFKWSKQKFVCGKIMVKRKITAKLAVIFLKNGGPNRDRTDDLTDANRTLSRCGKFSAHGLRHVGRLYNVRMDYNFLAKTRTANDALKVLHIRFIQLCLE